MRVLLQSFGHLWRYDWGLSVMAAALILTIFVLPPVVADRPHGGFLLDFFFLLVLISGSRVVLGKPMLTSAVVVVAVLTLVVKLGHRLWDGLGWAQADALLSLVGMLLLVWVLSVQLPQKGPISRHHIQGGVALYLLLGLAWTEAFLLVDLLDATAFQLPPQSGELQRTRTFLYFSFVTLTTLGYGDVLPLSTWARSLATFESLVGQLFPAILLARLVSLATASPAPEATSSLPGAPRDPRD